MCDAGDHARCDGPAATPIAEVAGDDRQSQASEQLDARGGTGRLPVRDAAHRSPAGLAPGPLLGKPLPGQVSRDPWPFLLAGTRTTRDGIQEPPAIGDHALDVQNTGIAALVGRTLLQRPELCGI